MRRLSVTATISLVLLLSPTAGISFAQVNWGDDRPLAGTELNGQYTLRFTNLAVERWQRGRRAAGLQRWDMTCRFPAEAPATPAADCSLTRERLDPRPAVSTPGINATRRVVSRTADGSLRFTRVDWPAGQVEFESGDAAAAIHVVLTVRVSDGTLLLERLRANPAQGDGAPAARDSSPSSVGAIEWRVAEYDRVLPGGLALKGMHSEDDRRWDEMVAQLSPDDRRTWATMRQSPDRAQAFGRTDVDLFLNELLEQELAADPDQAFVKRLRDDLAEEAGDEDRLKAVNRRAASRLHAAWGQHFDTWLREHGMSPSGRARIRVFLAKAWDPKPSRATSPTPPDGEITTRPAR